MRTESDMDKCDTLTPCLRASCGQEGIWVCRAFFPLERRVFLFTSGGGRGLTIIINVYFRRF